MGGLGEPESPTVATAPHLPAVPAIDHHLPSVPATSNLPAAAMPDLEGDLGSGAFPPTPPPSNSGDLSFLYYAGPSAVIGLLLAGVICCFLRRRWARRRQITRLWQQHIQDSSNASYEPFLDGGVGSLNSPIQTATPAQRGSGPSV